MGQRPAPSETATIAGFRERNRAGSAGYNKAFSRFEKARDHGVFRQVDRLRVMGVTERKPARNDPAAPLRPPWALPEWVFVQRCDACGACAEACREGIVKHGEDGRPVIDFRFGGCDFCGECVGACPTQALRSSNRGRFAPFRFRLKISGECLASSGESCRTCAEFCDGYAIRFVPGLGGVSGPRVDSSRCNGCGHCVGPCPVNAIEVCGLPLPAALGQA